ncbi:uncharacterized protein LOC114532965 [Dendronephthya gigantea]|uniref:uncharacterized protein LOC114532965 n=1 Tax=Dendronephthya gigantea TaxID=151771 RepID=UPI00106ADDE1|nr:uncharacterized protein LOC114532965 [Dendronephthya gigantea]
MAFSQPELVRISEKIPGKWQRVGLITGKFQDSDIQNIELTANKPSPKMKALDMLNCYQQRQGTRKELASALEELKEKDLARKVRSKYYQKHDVDGNILEENSEIQQSDTTSKESSQLPESPTSVTRERVSSMHKLLTKSVKELINEFELKSKTPLNSDNSSYTTLGETRQKKKMHFPTLQFFKRGRKSVKKPESRRKFNQRNEATASSEAMEKTTCFSMLRKKTPKNDG